MTRDDLRRYLQEPNVKAFLRVIREGESSQGDVAYRTRFGGGTFDSFADHPRIAVAASGYTSTAAGAYQFLARTWDGLVRKYGFPDFSPECQDEGAVALIAGRGALGDLVEGHFDRAVRACGGEWASLPGSPYGQPTISLQRARATYQQWGGRFEPAGSISAPEQAPAPVEDRTVEQPENEIMSPFAAVALKILSGIAPDLAPILGKVGTPGQNEAIAEEVIKLAKQVTSAPNAQAAAEKIQAEPALATQFRQEVSNKQDAWLGTVTRLAEFDEASRDKARAYASNAQGRREVLGRLSFIEVLSLYMLTISTAGAAVLLKWGNLSPELQGAIVTLMLIGGFTGVQQFWLGSSLGSLTKNPPTNGSGK